MSTHAKGKLRNVEVLFFDVFGTVVDYVGTITKALHREIRSAQIADTNLLQALQEVYDWQHFTIKWREEYKSETQRLAGIGNPEKITVDQMHLTALNRLIASLPVPTDATSPSIGSYSIDVASEALEHAWTQEARDRLNFTWHLLEPWPDSVAGMETLKTCFKIGTLTNGNLNLMVDMAKNGKLLWDFLLTADLLGSFKPDPEMYKKSMRLFNIQPDVDGHRACMVAAHLYDLQAAKACGMTTVFVSSRPTEDTLPQDGKPDYVDVVVADLSGLAQLIQ
ncbi:hypothetical protein NDA14_001748 [Ustilago hordei]|uniref:Haloacid dehalogenase, type II n=1 Tax=Ustilago hordei TaxID=120017 RepID=I2G105_USTHO|nr:uncharacterized protein UHO2_03280 [Ustilago hordei]KAJ1041067.1 hypothetical protein NDA10_007002 [Ustilago hordei]KAJ1599755.1 hypothetical protein NDA14_001748 [Ustilago hordei]UTT92429.1 hypothetical protein NDA17_000319 [Ustilago hordei]CCF52848.1 uncharacterized protein UHOR_04202 [Ustilago hordei]SYW84083.1 uncharacterized protein UHO2_03280 [Ustilago hordei]